MWIHLLSLDLISGAGGVWPPGQGGSGDYFTGEYASLPNFAPARKKKKEEDESPPADEREEEIALIRAIANKAVREKQTRDLDQLKKEVADQLAQTNQLTDIIFYLVEQQAILALEMADEEEMLEAFIAISLSGL